MEVIFLTLMQVIMLSMLKDHLDMKLDRIAFKIKLIEELMDKEATK